MPVSSPSGSSSSSVPSARSAPARRPAAPGAAAGPVLRPVAPAHERRDGLAQAAAGPESPDAPTARARFGRVRLRDGYSVTSVVSGDGHEHHLVTTPKRGPERRRAREAVLSVLRRAERQQRRVGLVLTLGDYSQLRLCPTGGYDAGVALQDCRGQGDDPFEWFAKEHLREHAELVRADTIIGVELETWRPEPRVGIARLHPLPRRS